MSGGYDGRCDVTLEQAVQIICAESPGIGIKKLVAEIQCRFPSLQQTGVKVGSKEVKAAKHKLLSACQRVV